MLQVRVCGGRGGGVLVIFSISYTMWGASLDHTQTFRKEELKICEFYENEG